MSFRPTPFVNSFKKLLPSDKSWPESDKPQSATETLRVLALSLKQRPLELIVLLLLCGVAWIKGLALVGNFAVDDAYISFSYSQNLALGKGPVYSNTLTVEGYSNFLWVILSSVGEFLGVGAMAAARAWSHVFFALVLGSTWLMTRRLGGPLMAFLAVLLLSVSSDFHRAIQSGLESVAFSGFIAAGLCHTLLESPQRRRLSLLWFSGAALTRIDGFVPLLILVGLIGLTWLRAPTLAQFKRLLLWFAIGAAPVLLYWAWRINFYGLLFPLPYYAKASSGISEASVGADYLWNGLRDTGLWLVLFFGAASLAIAERRRQLILAGFTAIFAGYVVYVGGDWMPMNRMLLPLFPPLLTLGFTGAAVLCSLGTGFSKNATRTLAVAGTIYVGAHLNQAVELTNLEKGKLGFVRHIKSHTQGLLDAAPYMDAMIRSPGEKLVTDYGGVFAYGTDASVIEMWGLANRDIALRGNHDGVRAMYGKTCIPCYAEFQPDYFHSVTPLLRPMNAISSTSQMISQIFQGQALNRVLNLRQNYVLGRVNKPGTDLTLFFLERKRAGISFDVRKKNGFVIDYPSAQRAPRRSSSTAIRR